MSPFEKALTIALATSILGNLFLALLWRESQWFRRIERDNTNAFQRKMESSKADKRRAEERCDAVMRSLKKLIEQS